MGSFFHRAALHLAFLVIIRVEWSSSAFSPHTPLVSSFLRHSSPSSNYLHLFSKTNDDRDGDGNDGSTSRRQRRLHQDEEWTLKEDWALMDRAPHFTVGSTQEEMRTFWTQLWISTPELSSKSCAEELFERYKLLLLAKDGEEYQYPALPMVGPSPDVLHEWFMDDNSKMTGQLSGRTVWFTAHLVGQIERGGDDSFSSSNTGAATGNKAHPGGFVEAVGNRVYELGQPKHDRYDSTSISVGNKKYDIVSLTGPWVTGTTAAISAFIACTILSAAIGYGAGLGIISDESSSSSFAQSANAGLPTKVSAVNAIMPITTNTGPSVSEQRAQMEARVLKEERVVMSISNMFEKDRIDLEQLRIDEKEPVQIVRSSNSNPIAEPSISEKRARKESKVLREERMIQTISQDLKNHQMELRTLRQQERGLAP